MKILVFVGPSGTGKTTIVRELHRRGVIEAVPSVTTRPRRVDEPEDAIEHRFVSEEEFDALERAGAFQEVVELFGLPYRYALPKQVPPVGAVPALILRINVLELLQRHYPDYVVCQVESPLDLASERILARQSPGDMSMRIADFERERDWGRRVADRIFDTSGLIGDVLVQIEAAIEQDFKGSR